MEDLSLSFYYYMCQKIVGTANHVKTMRLMTAICDNILWDDICALITSGSSGEGLQMFGSDVDVMYVLKFIEVHEDISFIAFNHAKTYFLMMTDNTKPGFVMLRRISHVSSPHRHLVESCVKFRGDEYLSNVLFKRLHLTEFSPVVHGPCVSDTQGYFDLAYCLHSKSWVKSASRWIMRSVNSWPNKHTKQMIINHGVLLVPIGNKESANEELEWRMSFSVGEKFLIYTFSHTQLLCYALMKILLKDVINTDSKCKDLLCSYYLKTIMFWISEELDPTLWEPGNLIPCFMRCFRRLIYCVSYSVCPHYFIPEYNLFEIKKAGRDWTNLTDTLRVLFSFGWRCIFFSEQLSINWAMSYNICNDNKFFFYDDISRFLNSNICLRATSIRTNHNKTSRVVQNILTCNAKKLKYMYVYFLSVVCRTHCQYVYISSAISNKRQYKQYNTCLSYLLMNTNHDAVSGWFMIASFFYKTKQYKISFILMFYALSKCTFDKLLCNTNSNMSVTQRLSVKWHSVHKKGLVRLLKFVLADVVFFATSTILPKELLIENRPCGFSPVVWGHFLSFLCHYHLNNVRECRNSIQDLQLTIAGHYPIVESECLNALSNYCLGTTLQLIGDNDSAKQAFAETLKVTIQYPFYVRSLNRLSLIASFGK